MKLGKHHVFFNFIALGVAWTVLNVTFSGRLEAKDREDVMPAKIVVFEDNIIKKADKALLGYNHDWLGSPLVTLNITRRAVAPSQRESNSMEISQEYLDIFKGYPMPLNRMSGTVSQFFNWKLAIGPLQERKAQKLEDWDRMFPKRFGPVEWVKSVLLIDPAAKFNWVFNMIDDTPEDHADIAEFFTGDGKSNPNGAENWAKKRIELGIKKPVDIAIWELGNELDYRRFIQYFPTVDVYIETCKKVIAAVKKVHPKAKFAAHAATAVFMTEFHGQRGGWETWHREVLKHLGDQIDYIVYHPYYVVLPQPQQEGYMDVISADILKITGSDRIKFYLSEHAAHPRNVPDKSTWYTTHSLSGVLSTAEWMNRILRRKDVAAAAYHCLHSGPWGLIFRDRTTLKLYTSGIADLFKVLNEAYGEDVIRTEISGKSTNLKEPDCTLSAGIMTTKKGLNIILVNREPDAGREISFEFRNKYKLLKETILTAKDMEAYNTVDNKAITVKSKNINNGKIFNSYLMPAKSIVVLCLKKQ